MLDLLILAACAVSAFASIMTWRNWRQHRRTCRCGGERRG